MTHGTQIGLRGPSFDPWGPKMSSFGPKIYPVRPSFALGQPVSFSSAFRYNRRRDGGFDKCRYLLAKADICLMLSIPLELIAEGAKKIGS